MFEPVHGSAPDVVGDGVANPLATVLSWSMLFEDLGEQGAADAPWNGVADQLAENRRPGRLTSTGRRAPTTSSRTSGRGCDRPRDARSSPFLVRVRNC